MTRRAFAPRLVRHGVGEAEAAKLLGSNAARLLGWWRPPKPPGRKMKTWQCDACHQAFEEAVNEAEALPTDQVYYEKFSFRYCGMPCLAAHRHAWPK